MRRWLRSWRWILCALLSGGATLAAEVMGARLLRSMLGSTSLAQTAAVSGVLLGLGLGASVAGRELTRGAITPRRLLVISHLVLAAFAALAPTLAHSLAAPIARLLVGSDMVSPLLGNTLRALVGLGSTVLPGALSGSAFPALVMAGGWRGGEGTARVGAANSLGAAGAASLATFVLAPSVGVSWTVRLAGLAFAAVAALAWASSPAPRSVGAGLAPPAVSEPVNAGGRMEGSSALLGLALVGLASTAWQLTLTRLGILAFGPSAFALTAALSAHVISLFLGEAAAAAWIARRPDAPASDALSSLCRLGALGAALALPVALALPKMSMHLLAGGAPSTFTLWSSAMACVLAATLPLVAFVGAALAQGARALEAQGRSAAQANGAVLLATSVGNGVGAWAISFGALPLLRLEGTLALSALAMLLAGSLIARRAWWRELAWAALALAGIVPTLRDARANPAALLTGPFLYAGAEDLELGRVRWRRDGREATVAVRRDDTGGRCCCRSTARSTRRARATRRRRRWWACSDVAMARERGDGAGGGPRQRDDRRRGAQRAGRAHGDGAGAAARGDHRRAGGLRDANHRVLDDPRVRAGRTQDAAQWLRGSAETYDVIVSEPSNPWVAGMSELFTEEFFRRRARGCGPGGDGGVVSRVQHRRATVASVVETFRRVFPRSALVEVSAGQDYLLLGAASPTSSTSTRLRAGRGAGVEAMPSARASTGGRRGWRASSRVRGAWRAVGEGAEVLSARDLVLEFRAPSLLYRDATAEVFARFARVQDLPLAGLVRDASPGGTWLRTARRERAAREAGAHLRSMVLAERAGEIEPCDHARESSRRGWCRRTCCTAPGSRGCTSSGLRCAGGAATRAGRRSTSPRPWRCGRTCPSASARWWRWATWPTAGATARGRGRATPRRSTSRARRGSPRRSCTCGGPRRWPSSAPRRRQRGSWSIAIRETTDPDEPPCSSDGCSRAGGELSGEEGGPGRQRYPGGYREVSGPIPDSAHSTTSMKCSPAGSALRV
jgi:spermidine synthase